MRIYSQSEKELKFWLAQISTVETTFYKTKKGHLLSILTNTTNPYRYQEFQQQKDLLLSDNHQQGWLWTGQISWLRRLLNFFGIPYPFTESSLLHCLKSAAPESIQFDRKQYDESVAMLNSEEDTDFEELMFSQPLQALNDIKARIQNISSMNNAEIENLFTRLDAFKLALDPFLYLHLIENIYTKKPLELLNYLQRKKSEYIAKPNTHQYLECQLLVSRLFERYVSDAQETALHLHHGVDFLLVVALSNEQVQEKLGINIDLFASLINDFNHQEAHIFSTGLNDKSKANDRVALRKTLADRFKISPDDSLGLLNHIIQNFPSENSENRYLFYAAKQLLEQLIFDLHDNREDTQAWKNKNSYAESIFHNLQKLTHPSEYHYALMEDHYRILSHYHVYIDDEIHKYDQTTVQLLLWADKKNVLEKISEIRAQGKKDFESNEAHWILRRLEKIYPSFIHEISHKLIKQYYFSKSDLLEIKNTSYSIPSAQKLSILATNIDEAKQTRIHLNYLKEKEYISAALSIYFDLLSDQTLTLEQSQSLEGQLKEFYPEYITQDLHEIMADQIKQKIDRINAPSNILTQKLDSTVPKGPHSNGFFKHQAPPPEGDGAVHEPKGPS